MKLSYFQVWREDTQLVWNTKSVWGLIEAKPYPGFKKVYMVIATTSQANLQCNRRMKELPPGRTESPQKHRVHWKVGPSWQISNKCELSYSLVTNDIYLVKNGLNCNSTWLVEEELHRESWNPARADGRWRWSLPFQWERDSGLPRIVVGSSRERIPRRWWYRGRCRGPLSLRKLPLRIVL